MVSAYSLPGTVLPKKKLEIGEYAVACLVPGTVHFKKEVLISECVMVNFTVQFYSDGVSSVHKKVKFSMSHLVKIHEGTHTKEKPYSCK